LFSKVVVLTQLQILSLLQHGIMLKLNRQLVKFLVESHMMSVVYLGFSKKP